MANEDYREDMDLLGAWITARCILDNDAETKASDLYKSYSDWCRTAGEKPISMRRLMIRIKDRGHERLARADGKYYKGLRLKGDFGAGEIFQEEQIIF
jgi:putative DNA primase/helicase